MAYTYCSPDEVAETIDLPDPSNNLGHYTFSEHSHPSISQVERMIRSNEDIIDRSLQDSWRINFVKNHIVTIPTYWHDENGARTDYYMFGGNKVQLARNICQFDPTMGDKVELRSRIGNKWVDITHQFMRDNEAGAATGSRVMGFWFDYEKGALYIGTKLFQNTSNALRISYRYGKHGEVPYAINRLCCLMTARQVLNMQLYNIKVGTGGDLGQNLATTLKAWQEEESMIWRSYQRIGSVVSLYR